MFFQRYLDHHELQKCELCRDSWGVTSCYFIVFPDQTPARCLLTNGCIGECLHYHIVLMVQVDHCGKDWVWVLTSMIEVMGRRLSEDVNSFAIQSNK